MDMKSVIGAAVFALFLLACSEQECDLGFVLDQVNLADTIERDGQMYYLYTRTVGWHEKVTYFELYDKKPEFDQCTEEASVEALYKAVYDDYPEMQYVQKILLQPDQPEKLKIIYTKEIGKGIANVYDVKFSR